MQTTIASSHPFLRLIASIAAFAISLGAWVYSWGCFRDDLSYAHGLEFGLLYGDAYLIWQSPIYSVPMYALCFETWWRPHWLESGAGWALIVPLWIPTFISLAALAAALRRRADLRNRAAGGCCISCGYDLHASGRQCPECGREVAVNP
jgi:hypothetical protein